jgi:hypothetical protein
VSESDSGEGFLSLVAIVSLVVALFSSGPRSIGAAIVFAAVAASIESIEWRRMKR